MVDQVVASDLDLDRNIASQAWDRDLDRHDWDQVGMGDRILHPQVCHCLGAGRVVAGLIIALDHKAFPVV